MKNLIAVILMAVSGLAFAETAYVTDNLMVGLHQENTAESPIIKIVPTGTALEVLVKDGNFIQVKEPEGQTGWVDNRYLVGTPPAVTLVYNLRQKITSLETELGKIRSGQENQTPVIAEQQDNSDNKMNQIKELRMQNAELEQKFKSERLTVGELQAKLAELRNQLTEYADQQHLNEKLEQLAEANSTLEQQIDNLNSGTPVSGKIMIINNWEKMLIYITITFITGLFLGLYLLDLYHRRRHGGFRI